MCLSNTSVHYEGISTPGERKINHLICCNANILNIYLLYGKHDVPSTWKRESLAVWKKNRFLYVLSVSFMYNHSLILVQCIELSELNLQLRLTQSPWAFWEILLSYLKFEIAKLFYIYLLKPISWLVVQISSDYLLEHACWNHPQCSNKSFNTLKNKQDFRRYEITYQPRKYDQATIWRLN